VGRAPEQVDSFIREVIDPLRRTHDDALRRDAGEVKV
jgi:hypothetical protein